MFFCKKIHESTHFHVFSSLFDVNLYMGWNGWFYSTEMANFNVSRELTFSNLTTLLVNFDLKGVDDVESLNVTIELQEGVSAVIGDRAWAMLRPFTASSSVIATPTTTSSVVLGKLMCTLRYNTAITQQELNSFHAKIFGDISINTVMSINHIR